MGYARKVETRCFVSQGRAIQKTCSFIDKGTRETMFRISTI